MLVAAVLGWLADLSWTKVFFWKTRVSDLLGLGSGPLFSGKSSNNSWIQFSEATPTSASPSTGHLLDSLHISTLISESLTEQRTWISCWCVIHIVMRPSRVYPEISSHRQPLQEKLPTQTTMSRIAGVLLGRWSLQAGGGRSWLMLGHLRQ